MVLILSFILLGEENFFSPSEKNISSFSLSATIFAVLTPVAIYSVLIFDTAMPDATSVTDVITAVTPMKASVILAN